MGCCPNGVFIPLVIDCAGNTVLMPHGGALRADSIGIQYNSDGTSQSRTVEVRNTTTDATFTSLYTDGSSGVLALPDNSIWSFCALITGLKTDGSDGAGYILNGCLRRDGTGPATAVGTLPTTGSGLLATTLGEDDSVWDVRATASGNNLVLQVKGKAATDINWLASVQIAQTIVES